MFSLPTLAVIGKPNLYVNAFDSLSIFSAELLTGNNFLLLDTLLHVYHQRFDNANISIT